MYALLTVSLFYNKKHAHICVRRVNMHTFVASRAHVASGTTREKRGGVDYETYC